MEVIEIPSDKIDDLECLWTKLNHMHLSVSTHFKEHFANLSFKNRRGKILSNELLSVFGVKDNQRLIAYCIATINSGAGEIYSIFVEANYRGSRVGTMLMNRAIEWLKASSCENIRVYVVEGNEDAFPFYESLGFQHRFHVLQLKHES